MAVSQWMRGDAVFHLFGSLSEISSQPEQFCFMLPFLVMTEPEKDIYLVFSLQKAVLRLYRGYNFKCSNDIAQLYNKCKSTLEMINGHVNERRHDVGR